MTAIRRVTQRKNTTKYKSNYRLLGSHAPFSPCSASIQLKLPEQAAQTHTVQTESSRLGFYRTNEPMETDQRLHSSGSVYFFGARFHGVGEATGPVPPDAVSQLARRAFFVTSQPK